MVALGLSLERLCDMLDLVPSVPDSRKDLTRSASRIGGRHKLQAKVHAVIHSQSIYRLVQMSRRILEAWLRRSMFVALNIDY